MSGGWLGQSPIVTLRNILKLFKVLGENSLVPGPNRAVDSRILGNVGTDSGRQEGQLYGDVTST
jgi:hypothetical protein